VSTAGARAARNVIVLAGQSLNNQPLGANSFANQLSERFEDETRLSDTSFGGIAWVQWAKDYWVHRILDPVPKAERVIVCMCGGTTDYTPGVNRSGPNCYADQVTVANLARAAAPAGVVKVIGSTTHPASSITGTNETDRTTGNALVVANASGAFDAVVDYAADPRLDDPFDTTYYQSDNTHETAAGAAVMVNLIDPLIRAFLLPEPAAWEPGDPWPGTAGGAGRDGWSPYIRLYLTAAIGAGTPFAVGPDPADKLDRGNVVSFPGQTDTSTLDVDLTANLTGLHLQAGAPTTAGVFSKPDAAVLEATLWDPDGIYDPLNADSPYGLDYRQRLAPGVPVACWAEIIDPTTATLSTMFMFTGTADRWATEWAKHPNDRRTVLQATDATKLFTKLHHPAQTPVGSGDHISDRITRILSEYGWTGTLDPPLIWSTGHIFGGLTATDMSATGWEQLQQLMELEIGYLHFGRTGKLRWLDRTAWTTRAQLKPRIELGDPAMHPLAHDIVTDAVPLSFDRNLHNSVYAGRTGGTVQHHQADQSVEKWTEQPLTRDTLGLLDDDDVTAWATQVLLLEAYPQVTLEQVTVQPALSANPAAAFIGVLGAGFVTAILRIWWTPHDQTSIPVLVRVVGLVTDISPWTWSMTMQLASSNAATYGPFFTVGPAVRDTLDDGFIVGY
jgi:hypothetical protein